jgi:hypothetical protein
VVFEYENHLQQGRFRLHSLAWCGFSNALETSVAPGDYDTMTFTGFGVWSKDGMHSIQQAAVQISTSKQMPYIGIQIGFGKVSNVNTRPKHLNDALP